MDSRHDSPRTPLDPDYDDATQGRHDRRDNKRAFRWGAIAVAALVVLALGYNMVSHERAGPLGPDAATSTQRQQAPSPAAGGSNNPAGPGTAAGSSTGAVSGTGQPSQPGK